jgi:acetyl esterase/lipase
MALRGLAHEAIAAPGGVRGDWIVPPDAGPGVIMYLHGGGYVSCSAATHRPITAALARLTGRAVFAVDYRLAPESPFPAAFEDAVAAYRWLSSERVATGPIAVAGESAGGGLALALVQHVRDAGWRAAHCVAALSPWTDLVGAGESRYSNDGRCAMFRPENSTAFASCYLDGASAHDPRASPLYGDWRGLPAAER